MSSAKQFAQNLKQRYPNDVIENVLDSTESYEEYHDDPVGFCEDVFGEEYTDDIKEMMESVRDNVITIAKSANAVGKTHGGARVASWFFNVFEDSQVYTAAAPPEENLKKLLWGEIGYLIAKHTKIFSRFKTSVLNLVRNPKSFLTGVAIPASGTAAERQAKFSGKHAPHLLFIVDEGDAVPDEIYKGIESCMSGGHVRLLIFINPRAEAGPVYRMERDGVANIVTLSAFSHPNVTTGENIIPGAVDRETTVRRINQWCRKLQKRENVCAESFVLPDFLVGVVAKDQKGRPYPPLSSGYYKITDPAFSYMVLGVYPAQGVNQLISKEWTAAARSRWDLYVTKFGEVPPRGSTGKMGLDCADMGNDFNFACFRYGGWVDKLVGWGGMDMADTEEKAANLYHEKPNIISAAVDGNGVGAGVAPHMRRYGCNSHKIMVTESATEDTELGTFGVLRDQLLWALRVWLQVDEGSMLPPDDKLLEEIHCLTYEIPNGKIKVMSTDTIKELLKRSPDRLMSLTMTHAKTKDHANPYIHKERKKVKFAW
jgi:hypothetical protein